MKKNMISGFLISLLISFGAAADVINPIGEENLGYLRLNAPLSTSGKNLFVAYLNYDQQLRQIENQKDFRMLKGNYCFHSLSGIYFGELPCFSILPKQTTVFDNIASVTLLPTDIEDVGQWDSTLPKAQIINVQSKAETLGNLHSDPYEFWLAPGNYNIIWSDWLPGYPKLTPTSFSISKGQTLPVQLTTLSKSYVTELTFSKTGQAVFPDAVENSVDCTQADMGYLRSSKHFIFRDLNLSASASVLDVFYNKKVSKSQATLFFDSLMQSKLRFYPYLGVNYTLLTNGIPYTFQFTQPASKLEIPIKRIDVNKVTVTREDGSDYETSGKYTIDVKINGKYQRVNVPKMVFTKITASQYGCGLMTQSIFNTETGLDLPPNEYKFTVYYNTLEGKDQTKEYFLDLR
jgi:hypothetical protein